MPTTKKKIPTASILKRPNEVHQQSSENTTKSSHSQFFPFSYHHICQISDVCQPFMQEKGELEGGGFGGGWGAYLRFERSPGFKQQRRLHFASLPPPPTPPPLLFYCFFSSPSLPASQRVSTAESAPDRMKMSPCALCHTWILYSCRRGEAGRSCHRTDAVLIPHQPRGRSLVKAPNFIFHVLPQTGQNTVAQSYF